MCSVDFPVWELEEVLFGITWLRRQPLTLESQALFPVSGSACEGGSLTSPAGILRPSPGSIPTSLRRLLCPLTQARPRALVPGPVCLSRSVPSDRFGSGCSFPGLLTWLCWS